MRIAAAFPGNTYISFDDAEEELKRVEEFRKVQAEIEKELHTKEYFG